MTESNKMIHPECSDADEWNSSPEYTEFVHVLPPSKFLEVTDLLLERPNLNSSHLFRADILSDSAAKLQTTREKEESSGWKTSGSPATHDRVLQQHEFLFPSVSHATATPRAGNDDSHHVPLMHLSGCSGLSLKRTVVRELIPRKPQLDAPLRQTCLLYHNRDHPDHASAMLVVYVPHVTSADQMPWYHPRVRALAYEYRPEHHGARISVHYMPFPGSPSTLSDRLHRTLLSLLHTFSRLARMGLPSQPSTHNASGPMLPSARPTNAAALRDTILPQHIVQDTYSRLKQTYAADLIARWTEKTDPAKHVFEDIAIAAFLIELWRTMYQHQTFPGFVDAACGNGVLVYILAKEGFQGHGFDARRRKTWEVLNIDDRLFEKLCIPKPFLDVLDKEDLGQLGEIDINDGIYAPGTFIISNHADELNLWTPILAALSSPEAHLPFLAIPCCSHALSGSLRRYTAKDIDASLSGERQCYNHETDSIPQSEQPHKGDLKVLRAQKAQAASHGNDKSTYASLAKKTVALAEELEFEIEMTLMRIPSTRNIGIVGNRHGKRRADADGDSERFKRLLERECSAEGGIHKSAQLWVDRAHRHIKGKGRGKVNLKGPMKSCGGENGPHGHDVET